MLGTQNELKTLGVIIPCKQINVTRRVRHNIIYNRSGVTRRRPLRNVTATTLIDFEYRSRRLFPLSDVVGAVVQKRIRRPRRYRVIYIRRRLARA